MGSDTGGGRARSSNPVVVLLAIVAVAGAAIGGMAMAGDGPAPADEILANAEAQYASADTVVGSATGTAGNGTANRSAEVAFVLTDDNESRIAVTADNRTIVVGSNGTVAWVHDEQTRLTRVADIPEYNESANATLEEWNGSLGAHSTSLAALNGTSLGEWNGSEGPWRGAGDYHNGSYSDRNASAVRTFLWDWTAENTSAERVGAETIEGIETHVIEIDPDTERRNGTLTLWIGTEDEALRKAEFTREEWTLTVTFSEVRFNVSVADSTFDPPGIATPEGATIVDSFEELNASVAFDIPRLADDAYAFTSGSTVVYGNATAAIGEYAGPGNVTLVTASGDGFPASDEIVGEAENATEIEIGGVTATVAETDRGIAVSWTEDGLRYAILSDLPRAATVDLAEAVIRAD